MTDVYNALSDSLAQIRIAMILPAQKWNHDIHCYLEAVSLNDEPEYEALSYCWGRSDVTETIQLCGYESPVTANLAAALRQFRASAANEPLRLWIDAICINQADLNERSQQVSLMRAIYQQASRVRVWLGPAVPGIEKAFSILSLLDYAAFRVVIGSSAMLSTASDVNRPQTREQWQSLALLFRNPYWKRRWITQEVVLARSTVFWSGHFQLRPGDTSKLFQHLLASGNAMDDLHRQSKGIKPDIIAVWDAVAPLNAGQHLRTKGVKYSYHVLSGLRGAQASDDRDCIYGILGLFDDDLGPSRL